MRRWIAAAVTAVGFLLMLPAGYAYLVMTHLVVPEPFLPALAVLYAVFVALAVAWRRRPWLVLAMPFVAVATLIFVVALGGAFLGWSA